jgi:hypothetical protein
MRLYCFRDLQSRQALLQSYVFSINIQDLNAILADGYLQLILKLIPRYWHDEIAQLIDSPMNEPREFAPSASRIPRNGMFSDALTTKNFTACRRSENPRLCNIVLRRITATTAR